MKKLLAVLLALAMVFCLAACGTTEAPAVEETKAAEAEKTEEVKEEAPAEEVKLEHIVYTCPTTDNEYFINVAEGCQEFCDQYGIKFDFYGAGSAGYDAAEQYSQFENFITQGVDGIICCPVDVTSLADIMAEAQSKGIVVIGQAQAITGADGNSVVDDYEYGVNLGMAAVDWINKYLADAEKVKVCLITLDHQDQVKLRGDGMEATILENCANAEITYRQKAESTEEALQVAETVLTANPDLKVIACVNDQMAIGAWQAVQNLNLYADDFYIGGGDNTSQIASYIADEACAIRQSIDIGPAQSGIDCCQMIYDKLINGKDGSDMYFSFKPNWQAGVMD